MPASRANALLGQPADARLLIVNADDFGMCHAVNAAAIGCFEAGIVGSTSLMAPCPWAPHAMRLLAEHPELPFGIHLTAFCETVNYRWGPLTSRSEVPSLVDAAGFFHSSEQMPQFLVRARLEELAVEFRAQIETVLASGLEPTHLDWHCLASGGRDDILEMTFDLGREYGLALRIANQPVIGRVQGRGLACDDHEFVDSFSLDLADKSARYAQMLRELPVGLSEWAVHPGFDNAELQTMEAGNRVRQSDVDFLTSPEARQIVQEEGIVLLDYRPIQEQWRRVHQDVENAPPAPS